MKLSCVVNAEKSVLVIEDEEVLEFGVGIEVLLEYGVELCIEGFSADVLFHFVNLL